MMHRFLAFVSAIEPHIIPPALSEMVRDPSAGWACAFSEGPVHAWVHSTSPTKLGFRCLSPSEGRGCLIGLDFARPPEVSFPQSADLVDPLLTRRWGAYVAIRYDGARKIVNILRDPTGRIECWIIPLRDGHLIFSHLTDAMGVIDQALSINWDFIHFHISNSSYRGSETGYNEITELLPGEEAAFHGWSLKRSRLWRPEFFLDHQFETAMDARDALRLSAEAAVANWAHCYDTIALDLSGGLDSAIILGLLRKRASHLGVHGINYVIPHAEGDERAFARSAAALHGVELTEVDVTDAITVPAPCSFAKLLRPAARTLPLGYDHVGSEFAREIRADSFFTGSGGDHLFHENAASTLAIDDCKARGLGGVIIAAHEAAQLSHSTIWEPIRHVVAYRFGKRNDISKVLSSKIPLLLRDEVGEGRRNELTHPTAVAAAPLATPSRFTQILSLLELQNHYWRYGRADISEETHPFFSQLLVEASLRTPMNWFSTGGIKRGLAKSIFADVVPEAILGRRSKGSNCSHWIAVLEYHLPVFKDLLLEGFLPRRKILDVDAIRKILTPMGLVESAHFSDVMTLITVEQWLAQAAIVVAQSQENPKLLTKHSTSTA